MALHLQRNLVFCSALLLLLLQCQRSHAVEDAPAANSDANDDDDDDDDSSSEETAEDSNEAVQVVERRKRRDVDASKEISGETPVPRAGIVPGLPDPATIIKIAEIVQTVGSKVLPLLTQSANAFIGNLHGGGGNGATDDSDVGVDADDDDDAVAASEAARRVANKDLQFLRMFKRRIDNFITAQRGAII